MQAFIIILFVNLMFITGCKSRDDSTIKEFLPRKLSGMINGNEWNYRYAYIDPTAETPDEDDYMFVFLARKPKARCPKNMHDRKNDALVMAALPKGRKLTKLARGSKRSAVFSYDKGKDQWAHVARSGRVKLHSITSRRVKGKLVALYNGENYVNGSFTATVCNFADMNTSLEARYD